jgi:hypothetical protein
MGNIAEMHQKLCNIAYHEHINTLLTGGGYYVDEGQKHYLTNDERAELFAEALREIRAELCTESWVEYVCGPTDAAVPQTNVIALPWSDAVIEKVAQHLWHCTSTRHKLPWSELPEVVKRGARSDARVIEQIVRRG